MGMERDEGLAWGVFVRTKNYRNIVMLLGPRHHVRVIPLQLQLLGAKIIMCKHVETHRKTVSDMYKGG